MSKGFTLVEILIVVGIIGILAAIVIPQFQSHSTEAKEAAAKDNLRILRSAIEIYAAQHNDVAPGYANGNASSLPSYIFFVVQLTRPTNQNGAVGTAGQAGFSCGPYISAIPTNPFNNYKNLIIVANSGSFPETATGTSGWLYKAATKEIRLNWPGTDSKGKAYYDY